MYIGASSIGKRQKLIIQGGNRQLNLHASSSLPIPYLSCTYLKRLLNDGIPLRLLNVLRKKLLEGCLQTGVDTPKTAALTTILNTVIMPLYWSQLRAHGEKEDQLRQVQDGLVPCPIQPLIHDP